MTSPPLLNQDIKRKRKSSNRVMIMTMNPKEMSKGNVPKYKEKKRRVYPKRTRQKKKEKRKQIIHICKITMLSVRVVHLDYSANDRDPSCAVVQISGTCCRCFPWTCYVAV